VTREVMIVEGETYAGNLKLIEPGSLELRNKSKIYNQDGNITLEIEVEGLVKDPIICIYWTFNFLKVSFEGYNETIIPERYKNYDSCYELGFNLEDQEEDFILSYDVFYDLEDGDYINVSFIDRDNRFRGKVVDVKGVDIGIEDVTLQLKY
jgi:hypothetical protein